MITFDTSSHWAAFFGAWLADPWRVAAIAPSGPALARLMTREVVSGAGSILELGPGTGAFTRALLDRGVGERELTLVECDAKFARLLEAQFPAARVLHMDATQLSRQRIFPDATVAAALSGLPLLSMSPRQVIHLLAGVFRSLRPGGAFYQFTYGPRCPVPRAILNRLGLRATLVGWTARNLPPAAVYRLTRRPPPKLSRWWPGLGRARPPERKPGGNANVAVSVNAPART